MSALSDYRLLWKAAFVQRQTARALSWTFVVAGALSFIGTAAAYARDDWLFALRVGVAISLIVMQVLWTVHLIPGFAMMNTAANARLVPRMRRRMMEMTVAGWLAAGLATLLFPVWQAAPAVVLYMIGLSAGRSGNRVAVSIGVLMPVSYVVLKSLPPQFLAFFLSAPGFICVCLIAVLVGAWAISLVYPDGGDSHFDERKQRVNAIERMDVTTIPASAPTERNNLLAGFALRKMIRTGQPRRLMLYALGPTVSVTVMGMGWGFVVAVGGGAHLLMQWFGYAGKGASLSLLGWIIFLTITLTMQVAVCMSWRSQIKSTKGEQGLLRLAARSPSAGEWNRALGGALAGKVALDTILATAATILLGIVTGLDRDNVVWVAALVLALLMPCVAFVLVDYSREQRPWSLPRTLFALAVAVVAVAFHLVLQLSIGPESWLLLAAYSNVIGALAAVVRWKKMLAAPVAFPAGRFA